MPTLRARCRVGRTGHRLTLWQVPEVCNLLRHLNINKNLSWKYTQHAPGREASPGEIREGCGLFGAGHCHDLGTFWQREHPTLQPGGVKKPVIYVGLSGLQRPLQVPTLQPLRQQAGLPRATPTGYTQGQPEDTTRKRQGPAWWCLGKTKGW